MKPNSRTMGGIGVLVGCALGNLVSVTPLNYSYLDIASQKTLNDYGVLIIYKG